MLPHPEYIPAGLIIFAPVSEAIWIFVAASTLSIGPSGPTQLVVYVISGLALLGLLTSAFVGYFVYLLLDRRNGHIEREQILLSTALDTAKYGTSQNEVKAFFPLNSAERNLLNFNESATEKSAILWGLLAATPYVGWLAAIYALSFLSSDLKKHELAEASVVQEIDRWLQAKGRQTLPVRLRWSRFRNSIGLAAVCTLFLGVAAFGAMLALSANILVAGSQQVASGVLGVLLLIIGTVAFAIVLDLWLFVSIKDPEPHFLYHMAWEPMVGAQHDAALAKENTV